MRWHQIICEIQTVPSLRPAIGHNGKVYADGIPRVGYMTHRDVLNAMPPEVKRAAMGDPDNRGFITSSGRFLDREQAAVYARRNHLWSKDAPDYVVNARIFASEWLYLYGSNSPRSEIIAEAAPSIVSQPRDDVAQKVEQWFASHGIVSKANLASPLAIHLLGHTESILIDVRDWPDGKVDSLSQLQAHQGDFNRFIEQLGWHFANQSHPNHTDLGTTMRIKIAPNYPTKTVEVPRLLTHSTRQHNVASILRNGLEPRSDSAGDKYPPRVYLALPGDGAWELTQSLKGDDRDPWVTLEVDTSKIPHAVFYADPEASNGVWTYQAIPPDAISYRPMNEIIGEAYAGSFSGRKGEVEVFRNPNRRELRALTEHDSVRMYLVGGDAVAWNPYGALHSEIAFMMGEELHMTRDAIPIILSYQGRTADCMVTDASRNSNWFHNKNTKAAIVQNRYLRSMFSTIEVSYFDSDIVGDWTELVDDEQ